MNKKVEMMFSSGKPNDWLSYKKALLRSLIIGYLSVGIFTFIASVVFDNFGIGRVGDSVGVVHGLASVSMGFILGYFVMSITLVFKCPNCGDDFFKMLKIVSRKPKGKCMHCQIEFGEQVVE